MVPIKEEPSKEDVAKQAKQPPREVDPQEIIFSLMNGQLEENAKQSLLLEAMLKEQLVTNKLLGELVQLVKLQEQSVNQRPRTASSLDSVVQQLLNPKK